MESRTAVVVAVEMAGALHGRPQSGPDLAVLVEAHLLK